jgi:type VI secretion system protein ImpC
VRDREGSFQEAEEYERFLNEWIQQYVSADRKSLSSGEESRFPLSQASVRVRQAPQWWSKRNSYEIVVSLTPCLQLGDREQPITTSMTVRMS